MRIVDGFAIVCMIKLKANVSNSKIMVFGTAREQTADFGKSYNHD